jgi:hypothetical protein
MARTRTLTNLLADIRFLADAQGLTSRHDDTNLTRLLNQSIQRFREKVSATGINHYLVHATGTLTVGPLSPFHWGSLDLSAVSPNVVRVYGLDLRIDGNRWHSCDGIEFTRRHEYQDQTGARNGITIAFANYQTAKLALFPPPAGAYTYVAWYLPVLADLAGASDTFDGVAGWEEWLYWDVLIKLINRDQYPQAYEMAASERERVWADVQKASGRVNRASFTVRRDTWGEADAKATYSRNRGLW